ncbi:hypothetical protein CVT25_007339 [Psilocybe cyanescens]|uniref:Uncharacterized protein n=1 Tax=Psilocybe cyanescens TaxID=93625 RepID=A0A409XJE4_PSICY|nr:hypothetical protein CVT25_007339 [Psilocybe cyanescens]
MQGPGLFNDDLGTPQTQHGIVLAGYSFFDNLNMAGSVLDQDFSAQHPVPYTLVIRRTLLFLPPPEEASQRVHSYPHPIQEELFCTLTRNRLRRQPLCPITLGEPDHIASTSPGIDNKPGKPHLTPVRTSTSLQKSLASSIPSRTTHTPRLHQPPRPRSSTRLYQTSGIAHTDRPSSCTPSLRHTTPSHAPSLNPLLPPPGPSRTPGLQ